VKILLNGEPLELDGAPSVAELIERLGLRREQVAVELNKRLVERARHAEVRLQEGDAVEVVTLVGGG
jgi:sulfur carrier protein